MFNFNINMKKQLDKPRVWGIQQVKYTSLFKKTLSSLAGVTQWFECWPANWKVSGLILGQGTGLWAGSLVGVVQEVTDPCISHTLMFLSLSFSLPFPLSKNKMFF